MKLTVYKGFDSGFLNGIDEVPLIENRIEDKLNALLLDKSYRKKLEIALISLNDSSDVWVTYDEYSKIKNRVDDAIQEDGLEVIVIRNNLYPDYYPLSFDVSDDIFMEISALTNGANVSVDNADVISEEANSILSVYNTVINIGGTLYGCYYNYEYDSERTRTVDFYQEKAAIENDSEVESDYHIFINGDVETYLRDIIQIREAGVQSVGVSSVDSHISKLILNSFQSYAFHNNIRLYEYNESLKDDDELIKTLRNIAVNDLKIQGFVDFRKLKFYKNPDISKEVIDISQAKLIQDIIYQAENAYSKENGQGFRDIFITASTGSGKSVIFQIPAVYLAKKYHKLTIIIEPVKALMQDQKDKLNNSGFNRVEFFNSDLITQVEKEHVLNRIKNGEVDLLYLSPETLLSYTIETIIGDREIGLLIVDEAHIVTTWGFGFRPDYWYLGSYINRLRNQIRLFTSSKSKTYSFPICAFTATAINGGIDDSVGDTVVSLYMENPIKYIGYVKRDDIVFEINSSGIDEKLSQPEYDLKKCIALDSRLKQWLRNKEKTIVYFPYASQVSNAYNSTHEFGDLHNDKKRIGVYTGKNVEGKSSLTFKEDKRNAFEDFKTGVRPVMFANQAFGMGVDVNDVQNVYHYAPIGNLCDYVQEIGRAARRDDMVGNAIIDRYSKDLSFMKKLFGMSQIRQYQIKKVLEGIYSVYLSKKENRNFLISPESFTYLFSGRNEEDCASKLKICLLMLEKDLFDKYSFKVLISRPRSIFITSYICVDKNQEERVLSSKYAQYITFVKKGRIKDKLADGTVLSDDGDIFKIDLKSIWEQYHPNISFASFKYYFFNPKATDISIMPEIRKFIYPRQKISIETRQELLLSEVRERILGDFEYIADVLYKEFGKNYFGGDEFIGLIKEKYGINQSRIIVNSLFDLVDPDGQCVKTRRDAAGKTTYSLSNGNLKAILRKPIIKSNIVAKMSRITDDNNFTDYVAPVSDGCNSIALKLMSVFDYITYEIVGGELPEIFIRLNDPNKIRSIVNETIPYSNDYVTKAKKKHDRDVAIFERFFNDLQSDQERWNYIEDYFLGYDVLADVDIEPKNKKVNLAKVIDKTNSYSTETLKNWSMIKMMLDEEDSACLDELVSVGIPIPDYLKTVIKNTNDGHHILMVWSKKNVVICKPETDDRTIEYFERKGWHSYRIDDIDLSKIKGELL